MPAEHPARDMQDTLYLAEPLPPSTLGVSSQDPSSSMWMIGEVAQHANPAGLIGSAHHEGQARQGAQHPQPLTLLRTHTSAMQIRHMEQHDPPVRLVAIGPVYRRDNLDLTHTPMFHQVEGLVVGSDITLADLKGTLTSMAAALFGEGTGRALPAELLPLHRAERRSGHPLHPLQGRGLRDLQAHRVARDSRQRHGASRGLRVRRLRPRARDRVRVRHGHRARRDAQVGRRRHPSVLRERPAIPGAVRTDEGPALVDSRLRGRPRHAQKRSARGCRCAASRSKGIEPWPDGGGDDAVLDFDVTANRPDCLSIARHRARDRDGVRPAAATATDRPRQGLPSPDFAADRARRGRRSRSRTRICARDTSRRSPTSRSARRPTGCRRG